MARIAWLGLLVMLGGCHYVGNPTEGFGGFISDTHTFRSNPNMPMSAALNVQRLRGSDINAEPLLPEPGNVWPGPLPPEPTLEDIEKQQMQDQQLQQIAPGAKGSSSVPGSVQPGLGQLPPFPAPALTAPPPPQPQPQTKIYQTPQGPATGRNTGGGPQTMTLPGGGQGLVVPNGNGTSTVIAPDGTVTTIPTPKQ